MIASLCLFVYLPFASILANLVMIFAILTCLAILNFKTQSHFQVVCCHLKENAFVFSKLGQGDSFRAKVADHNRIVVHELGPVFRGDLSTNIFQLCHIDADFVIDLLLLVTNCSFLIIQTSHSN